MNHIRIAIVGLTLLATACTSGNTNGTATPGTSTTASTPTSSSSAGEDKLASVKPCELVSTGEASQLGLNAKPEARKLAGEETCEWIDKNGGLLISVNTKQGSKDYNYTGDTKTPAKFGKYEGYKVAGAKSPNFCDVVLAVTDSSSVQIVMNAGVTSTDTAKACDVATKSAELVAAKLP
ncbi:DUF3558 domain-containing protein [Lentzea tibetensis]|uniref:DUF3558 domain-containing protein n=1 Tax=Lentzea tibetensis TaxID=2591470 RepID=A0A563F0L7_9PSEU|nr:DUF3558 family protein [Lentzea tibetensis]TWP53433.1 DUF3558 domain-containing protein [Lentzea tibetensis]